MTHPDSKLARGNTKDRRSSREGVEKDGQMGSGLRSKEGK